ncbi:MAG: hypothetical protein ABW039_02465 [Sphingobium sp.]
MSKLIVISALQRSGTTALSHVLSSAPGVVRRGEIFHAARKRADHPDFARLHLDPDANFFTFRARLIGRNRALLHPSLDNQVTILDAYLDHLLADAPQWTVIDIKYNSWHHLNGIYAAPGEEPALIAMLRKRGAAIIHMKRQNLLARWLSDLVAQARGRYHFDPGERPAAKRVTVDPARAIAAMEQAQRLMHMHNQWFRGFAATLDMDYEKTFDDSALTPLAADYIRAVLGIDIPPSGWRPPMERALPDPASAVANWPALRAALSGTQFAPMAEMLTTQRSKTLAA